MPLLLIATAFLCVTIVLVLLQPRLGVPDDVSREIAETRPALAVSDATPEADTPPPLAEPVNEVVARAEVPLLQAPPVTTDAAKAISRQLRQPIRLTSTSAAPVDLPTLTGSVLRQFSDAAGAEHARLTQLIVEAVLQRQSDTYIAVLLNTAAERGQIAIPRALRTAGGAFDSQALLTTMVDAAGGDTPVPVASLASEARHLVDTEDSLAGIALRYYGSALEFPRLLDANPDLAKTDAVLRVGQTIRLPAL